MRLVHTRKVKLLRLVKWTPFRSCNCRLNWGMTVQDTTLPRPLAENIVPGQLRGSTFPNTEGGEGIEGMLNGTIYKSVRQVVFRTIER